MAAKELGMWKQFLIPQSFCASTVAVWYWMPQSPTMQNPMSDNCEQKHPISVAIPGHVCVAHAITQAASCDDTVLARAVAGEGVGVRVIAWMWASRCVVSSGCDACSIVPTSDIKCTRRWEYFPECGRWIVLSCLDELDKCPDHPVGKLHV